MSSTETEISPVIGIDEQSQRYEKHRLPRTSYTTFHLAVFLLTFACNVALHASRKSLGNVKPVISEEWTPSSHNATVKEKQPDDIWNAHSMFADDDDPACKTFLGGLDTAFQLTYAFGLFFSGPIGDRYNLRYVLCLGILGNVLTVFLFACIGQWFLIYNQYYYMALWIANGLFQSTGFPSLVAIMGRWFGKSHSGFVFGLWSTNSSVGNIVGSAMVASTLMFGYEIAMLLPAIQLLVIGTLIFFGLVISPDEVGIKLPVSPPLNHGTSDSDELVLNEVPEAEDRPNKQKAIGFFEAFLLPGVIIYSLAYAGVKLVHYSIFYWLSFYLNRHFNWSNTEADDLSVWYDVGSIVGAIAGGLISDRLRRAPVLSGMLVLAIPSLFVYQSLPKDAVLNSLVLGLVGVFVGGVVNLMSATIAADLGKQPKLKADTLALATVTAILDGVGSIGAAIGQILVPIIQDNLGWDAVFDLFIICIGLTLLAMTPLIYRDIKESKILSRLGCSSDDEP